MQLYHLMYHSRSALPAPDGPPLRDLGTLLEHCLAANPREQITGVLAFHDNRFLQVIEGPAAGIERVYGAIGGDPRHDHVELVLHEPCSVRRFASWSMAFAYRDPRLSPIFGLVGTRLLPRGMALGVMRTLADIVN